MFHFDTSSKAPIPACFGVYLYKTLNRGEFARRYRRACEVNGICLIV